MNNTFGLSTIGQITITVHNLENAISFYKEKLGLKFLFSAPPGLAFFDCGGVRLMLSLPDRPEFDHPASILYFKVEDIHLAHSALDGRGVKFEEEPHLVAKLPDHDLWLASFRDHENNHMALMSEVRPAKS